MKLLVLLAFVLPAACSRGNDDYPDLGEVPDRPEPTLTPERSEEVSDELRSAREEAVRTSSEGREESAPSDADDEGSDE